MKTGLIVGAFLLVVSAIIYIWSYFPLRIQGTPNDLGQQLVIAAEQGRWYRARVLLDGGADPTVTLLDDEHEEMRHQSDWHNWFGFRIRYYSGHPTSLPTALRQAMEQGNASAVKMLLDHHVPVSGTDVYESTHSGNRDVIQLMEDYGKTPLVRRSIAPVPFASGGESAREEGVPHTAGAVPTRHLLWLSSHELLLLRNSPLRFSALDLDSGSETDLPGLSQKWAGEELFDPDMLALSPDARWLLGFGGTSEHPTWLATEVRGEGRQEWDRIADADPAFKSASHGEGNPMIAWRDNSRWIEIPVCPPIRSIVRQRALGQTQVQEFPFNRSQYSFVLGYPFVLFTFAHPDEGLIDGPVGGARNEAVGFRAKVIPGLDSWRMENGGEIRLKETLNPGSFERSVASPDRRHIAWLVRFNDSEAINIFLSDPEGKNFRIVYEKLGPPHEWEKDRAEAPWSRSLEWTPDGGSLIFWRGGNGQNGLGLLRLASEELR